MNLHLNKLGERLHSKLDRCIDRLNTSKDHLEGLKKETEAGVLAKLKSAQEMLEAKNQEAVALKEKVDELLEAKKAETLETVADWKANHHSQKLEKRAERAESYADACVALALYYADEAEVAILEAALARQDADRS